MKEEIGINKWSRLENSFIIDRIYQIFMRKFERSLEVLGDMVLLDVL